MENITLDHFEQEVAKQYAQGNLRGAIEMLDKAIGYNKQWYHFVYKASFAWEASDSDLARKTLTEALQRFKKYEFWFFHLSADLLYRLPIETKNTEDLNNAIKNLDAAFIYIERANAILNADKKNNLQSHIDEIPDVLKEVGITTLNITNLKITSLGLQQNILSKRQTLVLFKGMIDTENRINANRTEDLKKIESEKIRIIEVLAIFTAVMGFIILTGKVTLDMTSFKTAMPILGALSLVLLDFVVAIALFTTEYSKYRDIFRDMRFYVVLILTAAILVLSCWCYWLNTKADKPITNSNTTEVPVFNSSN